MEYMRNWEYYKNALPIGYPNLPVLILKGYSNQTSWLETGLLKLNGADD